MDVIPNLSKSTLSGWIKHVKLTQEQEEKLENNIKKIVYTARIRAALTKRKNRQERIKKIIKKAEKEYTAFSKNLLFTIGLVLYWAEGGKKTEIFQFSNSDPSAVRAMMRWLTEICRVPKEKIKFRIFIHKIYAHENCEEFWSKITGIPTSNFQKTIYKPTPHKLKKNQGYKGCVQIRVPKSEFFWKVMGWINKLIEKSHFK
ncbi:MAG: hypothetical protein ABID67_01730 [Candidatus Nealsonbacteria bacterium]